MTSKQRLVLLLAITGISLAPSAFAQGINQRVAALEAKVRVLETLVSNVDVAALARRVDDLDNREKQDITNLRQAVEDLDLRSALLRNAHEQITWNGSAAAPQPRQFTVNAQQLLGALIVPIGAGTPGNPPFIVLNNTTVVFGDCVTFAITGNRLTLSRGGASACAGTTFEVLYLFVGKRIP